MNRNIKAIVKFVVHSMYSSKYKKTPNNNKPGTNQCSSGKSQLLLFLFLKFNTHHPEECCVRQGLVLLNGRENTEDQTRQNYQKSGENEREHMLILIKMRFY